MSTATIRNAAEAALPDGQHVDPEIEPPAVACACGAPMSWTWYDPRRAWFRPRWTHGGPRCDACRAEDRTATREIEVDARMRELGCDEPLMPFRWARHMKQPPDEDVMDFARRVVSEPRPTVGITQTNWRAAVMFRDWRPGVYWSQGERHEPHWIYATGHPGGGKSLFSTLLIRSLLMEPAIWEAREPLASGYNPAYGRNGGWAVGYVAENHLQSDILAWQRNNQTTDPHPLERYKRVQVLFLDDLGTARISDAWQATMALLIDYRSRRKLTTVITGNLAYADIETRYKDHRMVSRLAATVKGTEVVLDAAPDWRTVRPLPPKRGAENPAPRGVR